jgi:NH3-dependent NAD+ synthetase
MGSAVREFSQATKQPLSYIDEKSKKQKDERDAIIEAAKRLGIDVEGRDISDIAQDIVKTTAKTEPKTDPEVKPSA